MSSKVQLNTCLLFTVFSLIFFEFFLVKIFGKRWFSNGVIATASLAYLIFGKDLKFLGKILLVSCFLYACIIVLLSENLISFPKLIFPIVGICAGYYSWHGNWGRVMNFGFFYIILSPLFDRYVLGSNPFGEQAGYILFAYEGNSYGYIFFSMFVIWILESLRTNSLKVIWIVLPFCFWSAYIIQSKFLILAMTIISFIVLKYIIKNVFLFLIFPILIFLFIRYSNIFLLIIPEFNKIVWRVVEDDQSIITALLSMRNISLFYANIEFWNLPFLGILMGDLSTGKDLVRYVEMDLFHFLYDYGILGSIFILFLITILFSLGNKPRRQYLKDLKGKRICVLSIILMVIGGGLVGHLYFRVSAVFFLGFLIRYFISRWCLFEIFNFKKYQIKY